MFTDVQVEAICTVLSQIKFCLKQEDEMTENSVSPMPQENALPPSDQTLQPATPELPSYAAIEQAEISQLTQQLKSASSWFYTIAVLSVINSLIAAFGAGLRFIFGLGITSVADELVAVLNVGAVGTVIGLLFSIAMAGLFVIFGFLTRKRMHWVFLIGMGVYLLDGLLLLVFQSYLGAAFHAYVLFRLYQGLSASRKLSSMTTQ